MMAFSIIECIRLRRGEQVASEVYHRICVLFDAHGFICFLLGMKQRSGVLRLAELLHELAHDNIQLAADFFLQPRIALVWRNDFGKVLDNPAARYAAAAAPFLLIGQVYQQIINQCRALAR
jgi:hypothetical protein